MNSQPGGQKDVVGGEEGRGAQPMQGWLGAQGFIIRAAGHAGRWVGGGDQGLWSSPSLWGCGPMTPLSAQGEAQGLTGPAQAFTVLSEVPSFLTAARGEGCATCRPCCDLRVRDRPLCLLKSEGDTKAGSRPPGSRAGTRVCPSSGHVPT